MIEYMQILWENFHGVPYRHNGVIGEFMIDTREERVEDRGENAMAMIMTLTFNGKRIYQVRVEESNLATANHAYKEHLKQKIARNMLTMIIRDGIDASMGKVS